MARKNITRIGGLLLILFFSIATTFKSDQGKYFEISKNLEIFTNLYKEINTYYVDDLDPSKIMRTGIDAMLESLDPFTNYISESDIEGFRYITEGRYNGIGAQIALIRDYVTITEPYEDSPAFKAGLKAGDQIVAVEGRSAKGKTPDEVDAILKGYPGTEIELTVRRPGEDKDLSIKLSRDEVKVPNVPYSGMVNDGIGYIALTTFTRDAGRNVGDALMKLKKDHPDLKGVIFDLRGNGGGLLTEAVNVSNVFIPKGELVVTTKGKVQDWDRSFKTLNAPIDEKIPLVVLINDRSASASEIVSGVLQDYDRGVLLGQRSYGKGLVQNTYDIGYNSKVKMTTAKYYIPSGRCIQSVEYQDGEPVHIPDEQRAQFQTRNGRTVLDGGGVKPDLMVDKNLNKSVVKALLEQYLLFDYVTQYCLKHEDIGPVADFHFTGWDDFLAFLEKSDFQYETQSEQLLIQLQERSAAEGYDLSDQIAQLEKRVEEIKRSELAENKTTIVDLLEKEIASRYHYQRGKIQIGLRNDAEIVEAVQLINSPEKYKKLLDL